ncbi:ATP-dependent acyl-CoA ligase [Simplicispira suum]|uniref:ATP-dependent acyl-CoA ligase n=1 Tax=Simplicispira suum TaxID=2109915 RepID=A0A2S0N5U1_9BURK|nr:ATP-dependent acyl-CoA ligase [Simplicispira suum]AVO43514.1 ATP-dependent acyl-CoA ligase [Simplicispira suum]
MKSYPIRRRVLGRIVADKAREQGDRPFISFEGRTISYRDLDVLSNKLANGLAAQGVAKGTHVALMVENKPEMVLLFVALGKLGAVSVPLNTAAKGELLAYYLEHSDSEVLVADATLVPRLAAIGDRVPKLHNVFSITEEGQQQPTAGSIDWPLSDYAKLLDGSSDSPPDVDVRFNDLHSLLYTSGTTGPSKGNLSTHSHTVSCGVVLAETYGYRADDVLYVCLPVFHGNAWLCSVLPALMADASVAMVRRFSASAFWNDIRRFGVTQFNSLGAMTNFIWSQPPSPADRDHKVRQVMVVPTPKQIYHQFEERFGIKFTSVYALTDCGMVTVRGPADPPSKWESGGKPAPYCEMRIVDDEDFELPRGTPGEIVVRTREPWIFAQGYYNMPEATTQTLRNLWFHTGDRGWMDEDGYIFFVDRKKDAIRRRGENISSFEVEQMILMHPAVLDVAAFPVHSEHSEDEVMVSVVLRDGARLTEAELLHHCNDNMAYFMVPRYVEFLAQLPKTMTEKVEKYKLKEDAQRRLGEIWDREKFGIVVKR